MSHRSTRRLAAIAAASALALAATGGALVGATAAPGQGAGADAGSDAAGRAGVDSTSAVVQLASAPLSTSERTRPAPGRKIDFSGAEVRAERARLAAERAAFKRWLRQNAPSARVVGEFDVAVNAVSVDLDGTSLDTLRSAPGVVSADFQATYVPLAHEDPDLALIGGSAGWALAGDGSGVTVGEGVRVAVVDSGIDPTHPCFAPAQDRIVVEKVFHMRARQQGYSAIPTVESHGTHVAGTIGCNAHTDAAVNGVQVDYDPSGVAPGVDLGNYNVFPADVGSARSEDILDALDEAAEDGMDVVNMSLGGGSSGIQDLLTIAVDNLDRAGIVVAVAAGNDGPGYYTVGSPGSAERALTAGASSVGHYMALPLTGVDAAGGTVGTAVGDFPVPASPITGALVPMLDADGSLRLGCSSSDFSTMPGTEVAVVSRGACTFSQKVAGARAAGAEALVVVNNVAGDPTAMGRSTGFDDELPAVMAGLGDRAALSTPDPTVTLETTLDYVQTGNDDIMAGFSSRGPTDVDYRVKPDVIAPGVNVLSSVLEAEGSWAFYQGTSMATPHLAGMAAAVIDAWTDQGRVHTAEQVRSAIVNTAVEGVLTDHATGRTLVDDANVVGAGLANLPASIEAEYAVSPVSTSFGAVSARSAKPLTRTVTVTAWDGSLDASEIDVQGPGFRAADVRVEGATATVTVTYDPAAADGGHEQGVLLVGDSAHSVLYAFVT